MNMRTSALAFVLLASCGGDSSVPPTSPPVGGIEKVKTISHGKAFSPQDYLVAGYVTVLDFYADW